MIITFLIVALGWVVFRSQTIGDAIAYIDGLFDKSIFTYPLLPNPDVVYNGFGMMLLLIMFMLIVDWVNYKKIKLFNRTWSKFVFAYVLLFLLAYFSGQPQEFIYFQF